MTINEPCAYPRCIHYEKQKKCTKCGRAYHNKDTLAEIIRIKFTLPPSDLFITKENLSSFRRKLAGDLIIISTVVSILTVFMLAVGGFFR